MKILNHTVLAFIFVTQMITFAGCTVQEPRVNKVECNMKAKDCECDFKIEINDKRNTTIIGLDPT